MEKQYIMYILERAILIDANLNGVSLQGAIMADIKASRVQMQGADLTKFSGLFCQLVV